MRIARSFPIIAFAVPLALVGCSKDSDREAKAPNTVSYASPDTGRQSSDQTMTPASRTDESLGAAEGTMTPSPQDQGAAPEATPSAPLTDGQIVAIVDAANTAEVDAAKLALAQAKNARVRKFAQLMIDHHGKAKRDQEKLVAKLAIGSQESTKLRDLRTSAGDTDRTLKAAPNDMFDKVYIDIQVADHQMVLDAMDREFIPNVQNPELKKSLQDQRAKVEQHLKQALELQKSLMNAASGTTGSKLKPETTGPNNASGSRGTSSSGATPSEGSSSSGSGTGKGSGAPTGGAAPGGTP